MPLKLLRATQSWPGHKVIFLMQISPSDPFTFLFSHNPVFCWSPCVIVLWSYDLRFPFELWSVCLLFCSVYKSGKLCSHPLACNQNKPSVTWPSISLNNSVLICFCTCIITLLTFPLLFRNLHPSVNRKTPIFCEVRAQHISWGQVFHPLRYMFRISPLSSFRSTLSAPFPCSVPSSVFCSSDLSVFRASGTPICMLLTSRMTTADTLLYISSKRKTRPSTSTKYTKLGCRPNVSSVLIRIEGENTCQRSFQITSNEPEPLDDSPSMTLPNITVLPNEETVQIWS